MSVAILGGAGTLGREIARQLHVQDPDLRIVIYSRDEGKQAAMREELPEGGPVGMRYMLGDICDTERLTMALAHVETVYHCAAYKMIDACEYDAMEAERVNVEGTKSVIKACIRAGVYRAVHIGTDKIPDAVGIYGKTKALAEGLWTHANTYGICQFFGVRYGNVIGSAKSVFHRWRTADRIELTDDCATRFYWTVQEAAQFVIHCMQDHAGTRGEVYIPKMKSYRMIDIAAQYQRPIDVTEYRCPEKRREVLWTDWETQWIRDQGDHYCLYPMTHPWCRIIKMEGKEVRVQLTSDSFTSELPDYLK